MYDTYEYRRHVAIIHMHLLYMYIHKCACVYGYITHMYTYNFCVWFSTLNKIKFLRDINSYHLCGVFFHIIFEYIHIFIYYRGTIYTHFIQIIYVYICVFIDMNSYQQEIIFDLLVKYTWSLHRFGDCVKWIRDGWL